MTTVNFDFRTPAPDGTLVPASGSLRLTPTERRSIAGAAVLPVSFQVNLVDGAASVTLAPTDTSWAWRIDEIISGAPGRTIYAAVPDAESVPYTDLIPLNPGTLAPVAAPSAAWAVMLAETDTRLSAGVITPDPDDTGFFLIGA